LRVAAVFWLARALHRSAPDLRQLQDNLQVAASIFAPLVCLNLASAAGVSQTEQ